MDEDRRVRGLPVTNLTVAGEGRRFNRPCIGDDPCGVEGIILASNSVTNKHKRADGKE
jgi:hypothetical protein